MTKKAATVKTEIVSPEIYALRNPLTEDNVKAMATLGTGMIPASAISTHPGKGGKIFSYVSHVWATQLIQQALNWAYSFDVLAYEVHLDGSATALCKFTSYVPISETEFYPVTVTEVGAFAPASDSMPHAMRVASAASRGLLRCLFRRYGIGSELYPAGNELEVTPKSAWKMIERQFTSAGCPEAVVVAGLQNAGITSAGLADRFIEAWEVVGQTIKEYKDSKVVIPATLADGASVPEPESEPGPEPPAVETPADEAPVIEAPRPTPESPEDLVAAANQVAYDSLGIICKKNKVTPPQFKELMQTVGITSDTLSANYQQAAKLLLAFIEERDAPAKSEPSLDKGHDWPALYEKARELGYAKATEAQELWNKAFGSLPSQWIDSKTDAELIAALEKGV